MQETQLISATHRKNIFVSVTYAGTNVEQNSHNAASFQEPRAVPITRRFGSRLRSLRLEHNQTQLELADHLGIDRSFVSDLELGKKAPSLSYLETIAQGFGLTIADLMAGL